MGRETGGSVGHSPSPSVTSQSNLIAHPTDLSDFELSAQHSRAQSVDRASMQSASRRKRTTAGTTSIDSEVDPRAGPNTEFQVGYASTTSQAFLIGVGGGGRGEREDRVRGFQITICHVTLIPLGICAPSFV
jgi:hypothetical protein